MKNVHSLFKYDKAWTSAITREQQVQSEQEDMLLYTAIVLKRYISLPIDGSVAKN